MIEDFLDPHPDEILYSVWARFSDHVSYPSKSDTFLELFGSRDVRPSIDLPCRLQCFVDALPQDHCYTVDFFINRHTLFPYYQAFLPIERSQIVRNTMTFGIGKGVHERTGIIRRIFPPLWLRFCPVCVAEDKRKFGECYWHRLHQLPGVEICPLHKVLLENSSVRMRNGDMSQDSICSAEEAIKDVPLYGTSSSPFLDTLLFIAQESSYLLEHPLLILDMRILHQKYHTLLAQRGFITPQGRLRVVELFNSFQEYYPQDLLNLLQCNLRNTRPLDSQWLGRIFKRPESKESPVLHPLYHLLVIHFLGFTLKSILSQDIPTLEPFGIGPWPCLNPICEHFRQKKILSYQLPDVNKNRTLVGRFSCECGYKYSRVGPDTSPDDAFRGKVLSHGTTWDNKFCELWSNTTISMNKICFILHTTYSSLNNHARRLDLPVPRGSLYTTTNEKRPSRRGKDLFWYREQWLALIENFPGETRAKLKVRAKGIYSWLIYNDREWFEIHSPRKEKRSRTQAYAIPLGNNHRRISQDRDAFFAEAVRERAYKLSIKQEPPKRISKKHICQEILELRWIPVAKDAPLTAQALKEVTETPENFALRRIDWAFHQYMEEKVCPSKKAFISRVNLQKMLHHQKVQEGLDEAMASLAEFL